MFTTIPTESIAESADLAPRVRRFLDGEETILILRGLAPLAPEAFRDSLHAAGVRFHGYSRGNSPRRVVSSDVFTSTEFNPRATITMHHELSYEEDFPSHLFFHCRRPAASGGQTMVASSQDVTDALEPAIREAFACGVEYIRSLNGDGSGMLQSWRDVLGVDSKEEADEVIAREGHHGSWEGDVLTLRSNRPAFRTGPAGRRIWFCQADQWHPSQYLDARRRSALTQVFGSPLPHDVRFSDGREISDDVIERVTRTARSVAAPVNWEAGDVLLLDNVTFMHGREPFEGQRDLIVALGQ